EGRRRRSHYPRRRSEESPRHPHTSRTRPSRTQEWRRWHQRRMAQKGRGGAVGLASEQEWSGGARNPWQIGLGSVAPVCQTWPKERTIEAREARCIRSSFPPAPYHPAVPDRLMGRLYHRWAGRRRVRGATRPHGRVLWFAACGLCHLPRHLARSRPACPPGHPGHSACP
ncbi:MAG: hypothetical protein ACJAZN_003127, partial [Planctomycetota bacterium]